MNILEMVDTPGEARDREHFHSSQRWNTLTNAVPVKGVVGQGNPNNSPAIMASIHEQGLCTTNDAAQMLDITEGRVRQLVSSGRLESIKVANNRFISIDSINAYRTTRRT